MGILGIPNVNFANDKSKEIEIEPGVYQIEATQDEITKYITIQIWAGVP